MGKFLVEIRTTVDYVHRDTNLPRNKSSECLYSNEVAAATVRNIMIKHNQNPNSLYV